MRSFVNKLTFGTDFKGIIKGIWTEVSNVHFHVFSLSTSGAIAVANIIQHESVSLKAANFAFVETRICERSNYSKKNNPLIVEPNASI